MKIERYLLILTSAIFSLILLSGTYNCKAMAITLEESIDLALKNNHEIKKYRNISNAQKSRAASAWSDFLPKVDLGYDYDKHENFVAPLTEESSTFAASASINLFNGFRDYFSLKSSVSEYDAARYMARSVEADTILKVKGRYFSVLRSQDNVVVKKDAVSLLERQRKDAELFYSSGLIAKNDLLKVEVELASARQELLSAEMGLNIALRELEKSIGMKTEEGEVFESVEGPNELIFDEVSMVSLMGERRSELRYMRSKLNAARYTARSERGGYLPSLDLSYTYYRFGEDDAFEGRPAPLFDDDERILLSASWNLFDGFKTWNDMNAARYDAEAASEDLMNVEEELKLQLQAALEEYKISFNMINVAQTAVDQANENYRITESQFKQRVAATSDLLDARFILSRAKSELNNARFGLLLSIAKIERVIEVENISNFLKGQQVSQ
ncbi:MAG: TolC family protein [Nitrospirota bacterium]|nr:MAG: TolC family protein [Nitrospirota bacterium]